MSNMQLDTLRRIVQEINASTSLHESLDIMVNHVATLWSTMWRKPCMLMFAPSIYSTNAINVIC